MSSISHFSAFVKIGVNSCIPNDNERGRVILFIRKQHATSTWCSVLHSSKEYATSTWCSELHSFKKYATSTWCSVLHSFKKYATSCWRSDLIFLEISTLCKFDLKKNDSAYFIVICIQIFKSILTKAEKWEIENKI